MLPERRQLFDRRCSVYRRASRLDIFAILPASRIRTERRSRNRQRGPNAIVAHACDRVGEHRMPIAIAPVDRKPHAGLLQRGDQLAALIVDRAATAKVVVMFRDRQHTFPRDISAAQHVLEEGNYVFALFGSAKRQEQQSVITGSLSQLRQIPILS